MKDSVRGKMLELVRRAITDWKKGDISEHIVDYLIANGATVPGWVSVMDRLPELHLDDYEELDGSRIQFEASDLQWVFASSGYQTKANYETSTVFQGWVDEFGTTVRGVTHWKPLPEPPKEGVYGNT